MKSFRITFTINGQRTEQIVRANTLSEVQRLIKMQYSGKNINFISTDREYL